ncbi:MAG: hypothetical protein EHM56_14720 [Chloroflexi bacterium]|nr:MAG: hypothetical protein EHM56_14720 [Chloroflexota bacterium]
MVGHSRVHEGHSGDVQDDHPGPVAADAGQEDAHDVLGPQRVDATDEGHNQDAVHDGDDGRGQLLDGPLLGLEDLLLEARCLLPGLQGRHAVGEAAGQVEE